MQLRIPLLLISAISLFGGLWQGQYIYDGYHWGFIFTNALELLNGHKPYSEIFLEYGFLTVFINAITLKLFSNNVYSLIFLTCLVYSLSLYLIGIITYTITENKFYSIFASSILLVLYPWPTTPWANFYSFFFTIIFCFFYLKEKKIFHYSAGLSLALAYHPHHVRVEAHSKIRVFLNIRVEPAIAIIETTAEDIAHALPFLITESRALVLVGLHVLQIDL